MTRPERERHWSGLLERQGVSGLSIRAWCAQEGIGYAAFNYWRRRLGLPVKAKSLTLIRVMDRETAGGGLWLSVGGVRIEVRAGFDAALLKQVVSALAS